MNNIQRPQEIATVQELVYYLNAILKLRGEIKDEAVASRIVGLEFNSRIDEWQKLDTDIEAILLDASDLEWSNGTPQSLDVMWRGIEERIVRLSQRYPK